MSTGAHSALLIAGPTASGKTALALHAAARLDGEIINADSMQVYEGLRLLTARPSEDELAAAPHHLFGHVDPARRYSTGEWTREALACMEEIRGRGRTPVLVGGTGLYFTALTEGLADIPDIPDAARERAAAVEAQGLDALRAEAERIDAEAAARIQGADRQRLRRVVEVGYATGRALTAFQAETTPLLDRDAWRGVVLAPERSALYARIERRFDRMMQDGAIDEARLIAGRGLAPDLPAMKALGLPPLIAHLDGEMPLVEAVERAKRDSRRYAKRQMTWTRNQMAGWDRIEALDPAEAAQALDGLLARSPDAAPAR